MCPTATHSPSHMNMTLLYALYDVKREAAEQLRLQLVLEQETGS